MKTLTFAFYSNTHKKHTKKSLPRTFTSFPITINNRHLRSHKSIKLVSCCWLYLWPVCSFNNNNNNTAKCAHQTMMMNECNDSVTIATDLTITYSQHRRITEHNNNKKRCIIM